VNRRGGPRLARHRPQRERWRRKCARLRASWQGRSSREVVRAGASTNCGLEQGTDVAECAACARASPRLIMAGRGISKNRVCNHCTVASCCGAPALPRQPVAHYQIKLLVILFSRSTDSAAARPKPRRSASARGCASGGSSSKYWFSVEGNQRRRVFRQRQPKLEMRAPTSTQPWGFRRKIA